MKIKYIFKTQSEAREYLHQRGWVLISTTGHLINDNLPGQTRLIVAVGNHWEILT